MYAEAAYSLVCGCAGGSQGQLGSMADRPNHNAELPTTQVPSGGLHGRPRQAGLTLCVLEVAEYSVHVTLGIFHPNRLGSAYTWLAVR